MTTRKQLELNIKLQYETARSYITDERVYRSPSGDQVVVAYLCHDDSGDTMNVFDGDSMGEIVSRNDDEAKMWYHLGRTIDGEPDLEPQIETVMRIMGLKNDIEYWIDVHQDDDETDVYSHVLSAAVTMWNEANERGLVGTKYAVGLRRNDHGCSREDDVRYINEVWVPDKYWLDHIKSYPEAKRAAIWESDVDRILKEYSSWVEGDIWGVCVETYTQQANGSYEITDEEACWGYVGQEYAEQNLEDEFQHTIKHLSRQAELAFA